MFFYVTEFFHLELGKMLTGSTISVGGERKKAKLMSALNEHTPEGTEITIQATEDATEWNECLSPDSFAMMHHIFFDGNERKKRGQKECNKSEGLNRLLVYTNFLMARKRVFLGEGLLMENETKTGRFRWKEEDKDMMNVETKKLFEKVSNYVSGEYLFGSFWNANGHVECSLHNIGFDSLRI